MQPVDAACAPTREECAYLAGLIDGEGCFSIYVKKDKGRYYHGMHVSIANTDRGLLEWVAARFGGKVYEASLPGNGERRSPCHQIHWHGFGIDRLVEQIAPFLVSKAGQADVARRFRSTFMQNRPGVTRNRVTTEVIAERDQLHREMSALNSSRRGPTFFADLDEMRPDPQPASHCIRNHPLTADNIRGGKATQRRQCLRCSTLREQARRAGMKLDEWLALHPEHQVSAIGLPNETA